MDKQELQALAGYASPRQLEYLEAVAAHETQAAAAEALGVNIRTLERALKNVRNKRALQDPSLQQQGPYDKLPDPYTLRGVSTNYDKTGAVNQVWVKSELSRVQVAEMLKALCEELAEDVRGLAEPVPMPAPWGHDENLLTVYPMGDPHLGMYAHHSDAQENFDLYIAERELVAACTRLVDLAPPSPVAILLNLGDFFHADDSEAKTKRSGNNLDVDGRWQKVLRVGVNAMRAMISYALEKHNQVIVRNVLGNHDDHTSVALSMILEGYYENEPRVLIEQSNQQAWFYQHGETLIATTHGHSIPKNRLQGVMMTDAKAMLSDTTYRYWLLGHVHHSEVHEEAACLIEYFRTLVPRDAYSQGAGYRAERDMRAIIYDKSYGEIERHTMNIRRVRDALDRERTDSTV